MKSLKTTALLALASLAFNAQKANANLLDFVFHNSSNSPVFELYVSSSSADSWEEDVLADRILPSNESTVINFHGNFDSCLYDVKAVYEDGSSVEDRGINLCEASEVTLNSNQNQQYYSEDNTDRTSQEMNNLYERQIQEMRQEREMNHLNELIQIQNDAIDLLRQS